MGKLILVPTPLGNLEDITLRSIRLLKEADVVLAEDTRTSGNLLRLLDISRPLRAFHQHNEHQVLQSTIRMIEESKTVVLISDAGTPGISDPGFVLIRRAVEEGVEVTPIPWASAVLSALVASGIDCHQYLYLGFLPVKKWRQTMLKSLVNKEYTVVVYESVHRIERTLEELWEYLWTDHHIVVGRELTKKFEEFRRGTIAEVREYYKWEGKVKGEFVLVF